MKKFCWLAFFLILTAACLDEPDCYQLNNNQIGFTFRVLGTGQGDSVYLKTIGSEEINKAITSFNTGLNYFEEQHQILFGGLFKGSTDEARELSLAYKVKNQFISEECGSSFNLSDLRIQSHNFDSARVVSSTPSKGGGTHIEIYRCPVTDTLAITFSELFATTNGVVVSNPRERYISKQFDKVTFQYTDSIYSGRAATLKLPVDLTKPETAYEFFSDGRRDRIVVSYTLVTETRYAACGKQTFARGLSIEENTFDSLAFGLDTNLETIRNVQDPYRENFKAYECPPTNFMTIAFRNAANTTARSVDVKSITAAHLTEPIVTDTTLNAIIVPVDLTQIQSTFRITYDDDTVDEFTVTYAKSALKFFGTCADPIIIGLALASEVSHITIPTAGRVLQYPSQTNVQIRPR